MPHLLGPQLLELIRTRVGDPEIVSLASPALAAVLRTWPSQTAATFAKTRLLDMLAAAIEQQRLMHVDQVLVARRRHGEFEVNIACRGLQIR